MVGDEQSWHCRIAVRSFAHLASIGWGEHLSQRSMKNLDRAESLGNVAINLEVRKRVQETFDDIERLHSVRALLADESCSWAWGCPSPQTIGLVAGDRGVPGLALNEQGILGFGDSHAAAV